MSKTKTVRVEKTDKLNQRKLNVIARRYGIPPISVRELQQGYPEEVPVIAAEQLERDGYVKRVKTKPRTAQERVDSLTTEQTEAVVMPESEESTVMIDADDGITNDPDEEEEQG